MDRQFFGNMVAASQSDPALVNMQVTTYGVGATGAPGLALFQKQTRASSNPGRGEAPHDHRQTVTLTFSQPVKNLRFRVTDVDNYWSWSGTQFRDHVYVTGAPAASTSLLGSGTPSDPWRRDPTRADVDNTSSSAGNVALTYDDTELQQVQLTFYNGYLRPLVSEGSHAIFISHMSFDVESCL